LTAIVQTFAQKIRGYWKSDRAWLTINRAWLTINRAWLTMGFDRDTTFFAEIGTIGKN
jgi:hypothetical protein